jgi:F-box-like
MDGVQLNIFDNFPDELLVKIFSQVDSFDTYRKIGQVCRHWRDVVQSEIGYKLRDRFAHCVDLIKPEEYWQVAMMVNKGICYRAVNDLNNEGQLWRDLHCAVYSLAWTKVCDQDLLIAGCKEPGDQFTLCCWTLPKGEIWYKFNVNAMCDF